MTGAVQRRGDWLRWVEPAWLLQKLKAKQMERAARFSAELEAEMKVQQDEEVAAAAA